mgnify:CR=1 FL=1
MTSRKHTPRAATARLDALTLGGEFPPKRIRMFAAGENHTTKGMFLFDAEAARAIASGSSPRTRTARRWRS